ncbi:MAG: hypothetical protein WBA66_09605 [Xanthobacteraceae bacterium]
MVQKTAETRRNVVDLRFYRRNSPRDRRAAAAALPRLCRHCGAWLADDESEDDCSSVFRAYETSGTRS